jgi:hypothetical protein
MKAKVKSEVYAAVSEKYPSGPLAIDSSALIISGVK